MNLQQIFFNDPNPNNEYSNYDNKLSPRIRFDSADSQRIFAANKDRIICVVESEILEYITDDFLCNDDENMFPKRSPLTGEWYISGIYCENDIFSVQTNLLGNDSGHKDDYLGLEIHLKYDRTEDRFIDYGVDSSCI